MYYLYVFTFVYLALGFAYAMHRWYVQWRIVDRRRRTGDRVIKHAKPRIILAFTLVSLVAWPILLISTIRHRG